MKIRAHCTSVRDRSPRDDLRLRDVTNATARVNWVAPGKPQVELVFQTDGSSTLVRMSAEAARTLGTLLIEQGDTVILTVRREYNQEHAHRLSQAIHRDFKPKE